ATGVDSSASASRTEPVVGLSSSLISRDTPASSQRCPNAFSLAARVLTGAGAGAMTRSVTTLRVMMVCVGAGAGVSTDATCANGAVSADGDVDAAALWMIQLPWPALGYGFDSACVKT